MDKTKPKIYGVLGYPAKHSLSPVMHNAAFKALDISAEYKIFEVKPENLEEFLSLDNLKKQNIWGLNITVPYKVTAKEILEKKLPFKDTPLMLRILHYVKLTGAINTVMRVDGALHYFNTDALGFERSLEKDLGFDTADKNAVVIGCGGAGRAVIVGLSWHQNRINKIYINDISDEAIEAAKKHFSQFQHIINKIEFIPKQQIPSIIKNCQLLVNASTVGMREGDGSIIDKDYLHKDLFVYDVVYNRETQLIKDAKSLKLHAVGGLGMLLYQGVESLELWINQKLSNNTIAKMKEAIENELKHARNNK